MQSQTRLKKSGTLMRSASKSSLAVEVPSVVHEVLQSPGQPLDEGTRIFMGPRFGHDFSRVRIHADAQAAELARAVNAFAYTVGRNIVFGTGQYAPMMGEGQRLLAHELAHVVQQSEATEAATVEIDNSQEQAAEAASTAVVSGRSRIYVNRASSQNLARQQVSYAEAKKRVLAELNRKMPVAILNLLDGFDQPIRNLLDADPEIDDAIKKLPPNARDIITRHFKVQKRIIIGEDSRVPVKDDDKGKYEDLQNYMGKVTQQIHDLANKKRTTNQSSQVPDINLLLRLLDELLGDLRAKRLIVRFDLEQNDENEKSDGKKGGNQKVAEYDFLCDEIHLKSFSDDASRIAVAASLVHEYAHQQQDKAFESRAIIELSPIEYSSKEEELNRELQAFQREWELMMFMSELGYLIGNSAKQKPNPFDIEVAYSEQLKNNTSGRWYVVQIDSQYNGQFYAHANESPIDLGPIPPGRITNKFSVVGYLAKQVEKLDIFDSFFDVPQDPRLAFIGLTVIHKGERIGQTTVGPKQ